MPVFVSCKADDARAFSFTLTPLPVDLLVPSTIVTGQLVDELAVPLAGVTIVAMCEDRRSQPCVTGADGSFAIDVPARTKVLCRLGLLSRRWLLGDPRAQLEADGITWQTLPADPGAPVKLAARQAGAVRGTLLGPNGLPLAAASVRLTRAGSDGRTEVVAGATDAGGRLEVPGLGPGRYELRASAPTGDVGTVAVDVLAGGEAEPGVLTFEPCGELRGVALGPDGRPYASAMFQLMSPRRGVPAALRARLAQALGRVFVLTDRAGRSRLRGLAEGDWVAMQILPAMGRRGAAPTVEFTVEAGRTVEVEVAVER
jgi:hypothetical protein